MFVKYPYGSFPFLGDEILGDLGTGGRKDSDGHHGAAQGSPAGYDSSEKTSAETSACQCSDWSYGESVGKCAV